MFQQFEYQETAPPPKKKKIVFGLNRSVEGTIMFQNYIFVAALGTLSFGKEVMYF